MAELSNHLMALAVLAYLTAMVCYAGEYAFGNRGRIGKAASRPAKQLVGAGAPVPDDEVPPLAAPPAPAKHNGAGEWAGRIAVGVNLLAVLLHLGALVSRGIAADRMPWGNMYEYILSATFVASAVWVGVVLRSEEHTSELQSLV